MQLFFYSVPSSPIPSPYFTRMPKLLADLSRKGIFHFRLWQGTYDAPFPVDEEKAYPIDPSFDCSAAALAGLDDTGLRSLVAKEYASRPLGANGVEILASLVAQGHKVTILSVRPRITELKQARLLFPTGERRGGCAVLIHRIYYKGVL